MLSKSKCIAILELQKRGHRIRQIARTLGASRATVRSIIKKGTAPVQRQPSKKVEPYRTRIKELHSQCGGNLVQVQRKLVAQGDQFSYPTLTRFARRNRCGVARSDRIRRDL